MGGQQHVLCFLSCFSSNILFSADCSWKFGGINGEQWLVCTQDQRPRNTQGRTNIIFMTSIQYSFAGWINEYQKNMNEMCRMWFRQCRIARDIRRPDWERVRFFREETKWHFNFYLKQVLKYSSCVMESFHLFFVTNYWLLPIIIIHIHNLWSKQVLRNFCLSYCCPLLHYCTIARHGDPDGWFTSITHRHSICSRVLLSKKFFLPL